MYKKTLKELSPLYEYWNSQQGKEDEDKRMKKSNPNSKAIYLYRNEPYKWENLFRSIANEIIMGDLDSIKGLIIVIDCLNSDEKDLLLSNLQKYRVFGEEAMQMLTSQDSLYKKTKVNYLRFLRILFSIYFNPYNIELKNEKQHIYEHTGSLILKLKNIFQLRVN